MKLLTHEFKFFKKIDSLCDPNFKIVLIFIIFPLKITSFSNFQFLISLFREIFPINKSADSDLH
jgi:hypothetical protein